MRMCENDMGIKYDTKHNTNANGFQFYLFIYLIFLYISCKKNKNCSIKKIGLLSHILGCTGLNMWPLVLV